MKTLPILAAVMSLVAAQSFADEYDTHIDSKKPTLAMRDGPDLGSCAASNGPLLGEPFVEIQLQPGDTLTFSSDAPATFFPRGMGAPSDLPFTVTATTPTVVRGSFSFSVLAYPGSGMGGAMLDLGSILSATPPSGVHGLHGGAPVGGHGTGDAWEGDPWVDDVWVGHTPPKMGVGGMRPVITVTCAPAFGGQGTALSNLGASSQSAAIQSGLGYAFGARENGGGAGITVTPGQFFGTTARPGDEWVAWGYAQLRNFSGDIDGYGAEIVAGVDKRVSPRTYVGGLIALGYVDLDNDLGGSDEVTSVAIGPYFGTSINGIFIDGWVTYSEPDYDVDGADFTSERVSAGVQLAGVIEGEEVTYRPFARLRAYDEDIPAYVGTSGAVAANDVTRTEVSIGSRVEWLVGGLANATMYASGAIDYVNIDSSLSGTDDFFSPRLGVGFSQVRPSGAVISIDLDAGQVVEDTYDVGVLFKYSFGF